MASSPWEDEGASSASDRDDALDEDMEALRRACVIAGRSPSDLGPGDGGESSDSEDDLDLLRSIQRRFSVPSANAIDDPLILRPLNLILPMESDEEDDFETLRAIQRRFVHYENDSLKVQHECRSHEAALLENRIDESSPHEYNAHVVNKSFSSVSGVNLENREDFSVVEHEVEDRTCRLSSGEPVYSRFPKCAQTFVNALKKNRTCQKFIRQKLIEIEAKIERNKSLKERVKCLMDFQIASTKRTTRVLRQKKDPRIRLISLPKLRITSTTKVNTGKPLQCGPPENSHVSKYRMVLSRFPVSLCNKKWSNAEKANLSKGIKQQYQERVLLNTMEPTSDLEGTVGDSAVMLRNNFEFSPEDIRSFLPSVNWERLVSMYLPGRSGRECEARWLNTEDPLINHDPWTILEEKKLLHIVQNRGIYNWIDITISLGTHRTPFQCLLHYQRSLNPCILKKHWTKDEDAQLRAAVEAFGDDNWQLVASNLEGRTGPQCSNRWRKSLVERKVGRWSVDEDKCLKVAVMLFGAKNWNKIAQFSSGRTQSQCRERWVNCLDPALNLKAWTEEEDIKLTEAIASHGCCWSKVASFVPPRTDNQCWRRWKVLFRDEVPLRRATWKMQKAVLITNFVDRESERPLIGASDFCNSPGVHSNADVNVSNAGTIKKKMREQPNSENQVDIAPRKCKTKIMKENATAGNQRVCSRKLKDKVEHFKDDETMANWLEVIRHKIISKKRKKWSGKLHKELVKHPRSEGKHVSAPHVECIRRPADVSLSGCSDTLRQSYTRSSKAKAKSFLGKLIGNGMEEPSVHRTSLGKRKSKRSVCMISNDDSTQSSRKHKHPESSIVSTDTCISASESGQADGCRSATVLDDWANDSRGCTVMPTLEENSTLGGQAKLSEHTRKRKERGETCKLLPNDDGRGQPKDKVTVLRSIDSVRDGTPRVEMANALQLNLEQTVRITEGDQRTSSLHLETKNGLGLQDEGQATKSNHHGSIAGSVAPNSSDRVKVPAVALAT